MGEDCVEIVNWVVIGCVAREVSWWTVGGVGDGVLEALPASRDEAVTGPFILEEL